MLSNPTNNLHNRQRQHRRQQSTPSAFEPVKVPTLPNLQRHGSHRRGMSLDQRRRQTPPQGLMVSNTNTGYTTTQQHILRETQPQRLTRPGPGQQFIQYDNDENFLQSPAVTPHRQSFDTGIYRSGQNQYSYPGQINTLNVDPNAFEGNDFNLFSNDAMTPAFLDFASVPENETYNGNLSRRPSISRRISGGIVDRVAQFEQLALKSPQRPITPPNQTVSAYFPPTPMDTPHHRTIKQEHMNRRFLDSYDSSMEETIKPRGNPRARGVFADMRREAEKALPSPPRSGKVLANFDSAPMPTENFLDLHNLNVEYMKNGSHNNLQYSPASSQISPSLSYDSSSDAHAMFESFINKPAIEPEMSYPEPTSHSHTSSIAGSYRRSESVSSITMDESMTDTGITIDDIAAYISGPDPSDAKWLCLYPECGKRFGRKENIKSHVQTHLGDRQFQCPHCNNRFVRQHDLKRHAKIHSGVKPYPCQCGNSFARHDALTRHRQRGMCIGAFEGVVKKTVKRGRPRKNRPDDEKRLEKSSRTRNRNRHKAVSSASSTTGCSESDGQSPRSDAELDSQPFDDYSQSMINQSFQFPQQQSPHCVSPQAIQSHSPDAYSHHSMSRVSSASRHDSVSSLPALPASPAKSAHSYHSPPGLCESSSSPAASQYYELEGGDDLSKLSLANISECGGEMFLEAFANSGGMSALERDPGLLLGKFDESYNGEDMFRDAEDVFFGSP